MSSKPSFSLGRAVSAAFVSMPAGIGAAFAPLLLLWALTSFGHTALMHFVHGGGFLLAFHPLIFIVFCLLTVVFKVMAQGAIYRVAVFGRDARREGLGPLGLQFGAPELRLLGSAVLIGLFYLVIAAAIFVVFAVIFNLSGLAGEEPNTLKALLTVFCRHQGVDWIFILYIIGAWIFLVFLAVRFCLAPVATIAQGKVVALNALGLSSGNVFKLFAGIFLFVLPLALVVVVVIHHVMPSMPRGAGRLAVHAGMQALAIFVIFPLLAGFFSSAYRQIVDLRAK